MSGQKRVIIETDMFKLLTIIISYLKFSGTHKNVAVCIFPVKCAVNVHNVAVKIEIEQLEIRLQTRCAQVLLK